MVVHCVNSLRSRTGSRVAPSSVTAKSAMSSVLYNPLSEAWLAPPLLPKQGKRTAKPSRIKSIVPLRAATKETISNQCGCCLTHNVKVPSEGKGRQRLILDPVLRMGNCSKTAWKGSPGVSVQRC